MLILKRLVEVTERAFEGKMRDNLEKSGLGLVCVYLREVEKMHVWVVNKDIYFNTKFNKRIKI